MAKTTVAEQDIFEWVFHKVVPAWATDAVSLFVGLHSADPSGESIQSVFELDYEGYARVPVVRSSAGWSVADAVVTNVDDVDFPQCVSGSVMATHVSVGTAIGETSRLLFVGVLSSSLPVSAGVAPRFPAGTLVLYDE